MPLPRWLARFNGLVTNRLLDPMARLLPGWGVVVHTGRKTHRQYRAPVLIFRDGDRVIIALTYGRESDWVRNVLAQGGCQLETQGSTLQLSHPNLFHDEGRGAVPALVRLPLGVFDVSDFLELTVTSMPSA
jgi:deazaflavin-dependent oxidoreductase (nitroreductase family)